MRRICWLVEHYYFLKVCSMDFFSCGAVLKCGPWPPNFQGLWITHNDTPQLVGLLQMSDQLIAETCNWQHTTLTTNIHAFSGIWTQSLSRWVATDLRRLRLCSHWDQLTAWYCVIVWCLIKHKDNFVLFSFMWGYNFLFKVIVVVNWTRSILLIPSRISKVVYCDFCHEVLGLNLSPDTKFPK